MLIEVNYPSLTSAKMNESLHPIKKMSSII